MILLDTSSLVHFLRLKGEPAVKARVKGILGRGDAVLCDLIVVELWMGVSSVQDERDINKLTKILPRLPTNDQVWQLARELGRRCRKNGTPVPSSDLLIASCAFAHGIDIEAEDAHFAVLRKIHASLS